MLPKRIAFLVAVILVLPTLGYTADNETVEEFRSAYEDFQKLSDAGDEQGAAAAAEQALRLGENLFDESSENYAALSYNYASALAKVDKKNAAGAYKEAISNYKNVYGEDSAELIDLYMELAVLETDINAPRVQTRFFDVALEVAGTQYGQSSIQYGRLAQLTGITIFEKTRSARAGVYLEDAYEIFSTEPAATAGELAYSGFYLGKLRMAGKDYDESIEYFLVALPLFEKAGKRSTDKMALTTRAFLVEAYEQEGSSDLATEHCLAIGRAQPFDPNQEYSPLFKRPPQYPGRAQRRGLEGQVLVKFSINESGFVRNPEVVDSAGGNDFHEPALDAVRQFRYAPQFVDGRPIVTNDVQHIVTFKFR